MNTLPVIRSSRVYPGNFCRKSFLFSVLIGVVSAEGQLVTTITQTEGSMIPFGNSSPALLFNFSSTFTCPILSFFGPSQRRETVDDSVSADLPSQSYFDAVASPDASSNPSGNGAEESLPSFFNAHSFSGADMAVETHVAVIESRPSSAFLLTLR